jgi:hypothetical protein
MFNYFQYANLAFFAIPVHNKFASDLLKGLTYLGNYDFSLFRIFCVGLPLKLELW